MQHGILKHYGVMPFLNITKKTLHIDLSYSATSGASVNESMKYLFFFIVQCEGFLICDLFHTKS